MYTHPYAEGIAQAGYQAFLTLRNNENPWVKIPVSYIEVCYPYLMENAVPVFLIYDDTFGVFTISAEGDNLWCNLNNLGEASVSPLDAHTALIPASLEGFDYDSALNYGR